MAAAGGAYVGKDGKLIIYGVEHDNDGPKVGGKGSVKMMGVCREINCVISLSLNIYVHM